MPSGSASEIAARVVPGAAGLCRGTKLGMTRRMPGWWVFAVVRRALAHTLEVPVSATSREVRVEGAISAAVGFVILLAGGSGPFVVAMAGLPTVMGRAALVVVLVGYGLFVIGGYRAVTGRHPAGESYTYSSSLRRIFTGVGLVVAAFALLLGLILIVVKVLGIE